MSINLPLKTRLKLLRQDVLADLGIRGHKRVKVQDDPLGAKITVGEKSIYAPSPLRWKLYRKGWNARLDQLANEYGVGRHIRLTKDSVILDIGANAGEFAHIAARCGAKIHCLEPDETVFACLKANITGLSNVTIHQDLIWKAEEDINFYSVPAQADSSVFEDNTGPATKMRATTVESFCQHNQIEKIDLLKCDAEGAEPEVLQGIGTMFPSIKVIALDTGRERRGERTNEACAEILRHHGFQVIDETIGKRLMTFGIRQ